MCTEHQRGHHNNNFAQVTAHLYKDVVLGCTKAYNVVDVVDFTVLVMDEYWWDRHTVHTDHQRGNHNNNFVEVTAHLYKDVILG